MSRRVNVSAGEARRIALAAQGFDRARPKSSNDVRHFRRALASIGVLQLDYVNVLMPAHFFMIWSRLGAYDREHFEHYLYQSGEYTEQWAHEASVVSCHDWSLLAHRRRDHELWKNSPLRKMRNSKKYLEDVLEIVRSRGATTSNDLPPVKSAKKKPGDWYRSIPRSALEYHFAKGDLAVRRRLKNFQRVFDLPERVLVDGFYSSAVCRADADRQLLEKAAGFLGIATAHDIADYYRMTTRDALPLLQDLVEEGVLTEVCVEGWADSAYLAVGATSPRRISGAALLSPFDPVVWFRPRAKRLFDFDYRIEIYVPEAKRRWGYYVLPFRLGDKIAARVDLKADRKNSVLMIQNAHLEDGANHKNTAVALAEELSTLAEWLGLECRVTKKANVFEKTLARVL